MRDQSMLRRSRNSGKDFWWNQLPCGPVLTPISCTKLKIHSAHEDSPIGPLQDPVIWYRKNYTGTQVTQWDFKNKGSRTSLTRLSKGPFVLGIWNVRPVNASQIKRLRKRLLVKLFPLWASAYTHLVLAIWMKD